MPTAKKPSVSNTRRTAGAIAAPRKTLAVQRLELRETLEELSADIKKLSESADETLDRLRLMKE